MGERMGRMETDFSCHSVVNGRGFSNLKRDNNGIRRILQIIRKKINFAFLKKSNSEETENSLEPRFHSVVWSEVALEISTGVLRSLAALFNPYRRSNVVERPFGIAFIE